MTLAPARTLNLEPIVRSLKILDKFGDIVPFEPNWAQQKILDRVKSDYEAGLPGRYIALKARQLGVSTVVEAILFSMSVLFNNSQSVIVSFDREQAEYLFSMTKRFYETWQFKGGFPTRYSTKRSMSFEEIDSHIWVMTAENPNAVRGRTYARAHLSEIAFYRDPVTLMGSLNRAMHKIPGNLQFIESTANGIGNWFEEAWNDAVAGKSGYVPFFFPWFTHYEYIPCQGASCRDGTCETCVTQSKGIRPQTELERELVRLGCDKPHLAFMRQAIAMDFHNNMDWWLQEMPHTPEVAFISSGINVFPLPQLQAVYEKLPCATGRFVLKSGGDVEFTPDPDGPVRMYKKPGRDGVYFIGADPSMGLVDGDMAAAQVMNRRTGEQVCVWQGKVNPSAFADELMKMGRFYSQNKQENLPIIACEKQGGGLATIERLRHAYPRLYQPHIPDKTLDTGWAQNNLGWSTDWRTKVWLATELMLAVETKKITIHDEPTFKEMRTYTYTAGSGYNDTFGPADKLKGRDDLVMSLGIAVVCEKQEGRIPSYEAAPEPGEIVWGQRTDEWD